jgi:hypothetical protein
MAPQTPRIPSQPGKELVHHHWPYHRHLREAKELLPQSIFRLSRSFLSALRFLSQEAGTTTTAIPGLTLFLVALLEYSLPTSGSICTIFLSGAATAGLGLLAAAAMPFSGVLDTRI